MPWRVNEIQTAVSIKVERFVLSQCETSIAFEADLDKLAALPCFLVDWALWFGRIGWYEGLLEPGSNNQIGRRWKGGRITRVVLYPIQCLPVSRLKQHLQDDSVTK